MMTETIAEEARMEDIVKEEVPAGVANHPVPGTIQMAGIEARMVQVAIVEEAVHQEVLVTDHLHTALTAEVLMAEATMAVAKVHRREVAALPVIKGKAAKKHLQDEIIKQENRASALFFLQNIQKQ